MGVNMLTISQASTVLPTPTLRSLTKVATSTSATMQMPVSTATVYLVGGQNREMQRK